MPPGMGSPGRYRTWGAPGVSRCQCGPRCTPEHSGDRDRDQVVEIIVLELRELEDGVGDARKTVELVVRLLRDPPERDRCVSARATRPRAR